MSISPYFFVGMIAADPRFLQEWRMTLENKSTVARISIYVQPRASKSEVVGMHDGSLKIRLAAPPVYGAANLALVEFVATKLGVPKSRVRLVAGLSSRRKTIQIEGWTLAEAIAALQCVGKQAP